MRRPPIWMPSRRSLLTGAASLGLLHSARSNGYETRLVFANSLSAEQTYGPSISGFKHEINDAQELGIDGFVLNVGSWSAQSGYYKPIIANVFATAQQLGTGFKIFFMADNLPAADIVDMMTIYAGHPNYFRYNGRPVLTTFQGNALGQTYWQTSVLGTIRAAGINPFFVPNFYTSAGDYTNPAVGHFGNPSYAQISADYNTWWGSVVDGLTYWAVSGLTPQIVSSCEAYATLMRQVGKVWFAGTSALFWEGRLDPTHQPNLMRRYYDTYGGENISAQWNSIINVQHPPWVMIQTYNDFTESYISPADPSKIVDKAQYYNMGPLLLSHAGYAELIKYYIQWYKSGVQPTLTKDALYYFYRTHSKNLVAPGDTQNIVNSPPSQYGNVNDEVYVTTNIRSPATLRVTSGGVVTNYSVPAGLTHTRSPATPGAQSFDLIRGGTTVIHNDGEPIASSITVYNYVTTSGFGYSVSTAE
jgi:Glycosyl hydrolase family 71